MVVYSKKLSNKRKEITLQLLSVDFNFMNLVISHNKKKTTNPYIKTT